MTKEDEKPRASVHVAGNSALDLLLRNVPVDSGAAVDGWSSGNVHFLSRPPEGVLAGNGGAVAYLLGRLGERVSLNTRVGSDAFGRMLQSKFDAAGVEVMGSQAETTAVNVVALSPEGARRSFYYTGEKVVWGRSLEVREADWFYASGYGQVTVEDLDDLVTVFEAFRERGTKVAFDPGPWFFAAVDREQMARAWQGVDCLMGTESELSTWQTFGTVEGLAESLLDRGPGLVAVKRGGEGAAFAGRDQGMGVLPTERVEGANTVGAGDTFNAGLLHGLCRGEGLEDAVRIGLRLATEAVKQGRGALGALGDG